ncbi:MAG: 2-phosphosulfolactate phosphatase [Methanobacteriaceae archaeon]|jgi:2-phosphosulfolactate phosphatase|nr:2-phosphosulfolactate phosphatase [Candidatus Methanorudis spinitermitis]
MKISLNLEKTESKDVSIMVDALRASTSIIIALNKFKKIIPAFSPEEAEKIANDTKGILAGEKDGITIENFDLGNSPVAIENYKTDKDTLILNTSNGTRILENMNSTVLIGCFLNAKSVAKMALKIATSQIDVVMAGWKGKFAIEDFLASGEILYHIMKSKDEKDKISEYGQSAILASRNHQLVKKTILDTRSAKRLEKLGFKEDVDFSLRKNVLENVAIYKKGIITLL